MQQASHVQPQHHQQPLQANSRIPTMTQNFNQISKTATNLLNDIYEKHLLNQTTFENVNTMNGFCISGNSGIGGGGPGGVSDGDRVVPTKLTTNVNGTVAGANVNVIRNARPEPDFNFNNLCHQELPVNRPAHHHGHETNKYQPHQQMRGGICTTTTTTVAAAAATAAIVVDQPKSSPLFGNGKSLKSRILRRNIGDGVDGNTATNHTINATVAGHSGGAAVTAPRIPVYAKAAAMSEARCNSNSVTYASHANLYDGNYAVHMAGKETNVSGYDSSDYGVRIQSNKMVGDIRREPVGGNFYDEKSIGGGAGNGDRRDGSNNKINLMLETAQAMAAAAYFARLVNYLFI